MQPGNEELFRSACAFQTEGKLLEAERLHRLILSRDPGHGGALYGLGMIAKETGHLEDAEKLLRRCIAVRPDIAGLHCSLAEVLRRRGNADAAVAELHRAIAVDPSMAECYGNIAIFHSNSGQHEDAVQWARQALERDPNLTPAMIALGQSLIELRQNAEAAEVLQRCVAIDPGNELARFFHAAATGVNAPPAAPREFIIHGFDVYAHHFDEHLQGRLQYRVPEQLRQVVDRIRPQGQFDILDLGCGTGLVGLHFRDRARSMAGVDLSEGMLQQALRRAIYTRLEQGDLLHSLRGRKSEIDLVLAGDVFIYVGELREIFLAVANALRPDGLFGFSIETQAGEGYILRPSRRYACSRSYIEKLAVETGMDVVVADDTTIRREGEQDVAGMLYVLRRPSTS